MKVDLTYLNGLEDTVLAHYAARSSRSRGRRFPQDPHPYRTEFQRDRERIIHCRAFRRLEYKTQVFINHEGDHYRTRLTHTIEVAQIARTIARALRVNEDLAESIALAHDLGHTPFGHAGERELDDLLANHGGFEHNRQSLRVVDELEKCYASWEGINLTWETREGIIKHSSAHDHPEASAFFPDERPSLEAQLIDLADEIAYNNHDLDDGITSGLLDMEETQSLELWQRAHASLGKGGSMTDKLMLREVVRALINILVSDLISTSRQNIRDAGVRTIDDVRAHPTHLVGFSPEIARGNDELKDFLKKKLYNHYRVARMTIKARMVVKELFHVYTEHPEALPGDYQALIVKNGIWRTATDYIAGMTDRYAMEEYKKLTDPLVRA